MRRWSRKHKPKHFEALPFQDIPTTYEAVRHTRGQTEIRLALQFVILTAARSGEVRGMRWSEIDWDSNAWVIPPERMKNGERHRIPLSIQARQILSEAKAVKQLRMKKRKDYQDKDFVFPHPSGRMLSENALIMRVRRERLGCTVHGFRSSFRGWASAQGSYGWEDNRIVFESQGWRDCSTGIFQRRFARPTAAYLGGLE